MLTADILPELIIFNKITNMELFQKVEALVAEVDRSHRYSMSRIYGTYNEVFGTADVPQSCASCLIRKVNELRAWLSKHKSVSDAEVATEKETPRRGRKKKNSDA